MQTRFISIVFALCALLSVGHQRGPVKAASPFKSKITAAAQPGPKFGILHGIEAGDYRCYLNITGQDGKRYRVGATFAVCTEQYLHSTVQFTYERIPSLSCTDVHFVENCPERPSANGPTYDETKTEIAITRVSPIDPENITITGYRSDRWDLIVSSFEPWSGVNGTGNATLKGLDRQGNLIEVTGGKSTCRNGECWTTWHDGDTRYSIITPMEPEAELRFLIVTNGQVSEDDRSLRVNDYSAP